MLAGSLAMFLLFLAAFFESHGSLGGALAEESARIGVVLLGIGVPSFFISALYYDTLSSLSFKVAAVILMAAGGSFLLIGLGLFARKAWARFAFIGVSFLTALQVLLVETIVFGKATSDSYLALHAAAHAVIIGLAVISVIVGIAGFDRFAFSEDVKRIFGGAA